MLKSTIREMILDYFRLIKGWRLAVVIVLFAFYSLSSILEKGESIRFIPPFAIVFPLMMMPEINKINYLLPRDKKDMIRHFIMKNVGNHVITFLLFLILIVISNLVNRKQWTYNIDRLFIEMLPFLITYAALNMTGKYNAITTNNNAWMRKNRYKYYSSFVFVIIPIAFGSIDARDTFQGIWYPMLAILSYIGAFVIVYWQIQVVRHTDFSFENIRKVEKIFG